MIGKHINLCLVLYLAEKPESLLKMVSTFRNTNVLPPIHFKYIFKARRYIDIYIYIYLYITYLNFYKMFSKFGNNNLLYLKAW